MNFIKLIPIELIKIRRSRIFWILLIPVVIMWLPSILNADMNFQMADVGITPEHNFFIQGFMGMSWFMIPATLVISTVLLNQTERTNKGILRMLSLPVNRSALCIAKFVVMILLSLCQMVMSIAAYWISASIASRQQEYAFLLELPYVARVAGQLYLAAIPMAAVFWMLAALIRTPVFSVGIGLALMVPSVLLINTRLWVAYPMDYPFYILMTEYGKAAAGIFTTELQLTPLVPVAVSITVFCLGISCLTYGKNAFS